MPTPLSGHLEARLLADGRGQRGSGHNLSDPSARGRISLSSRGLKDSEINRCLSTPRSVIDRATAGTACTS
jgi:hypothetical protein